MNLEQIKSIILTGLVFLSIFLFGYIMTFQQNYDQINNQEYVAEITISRKVDIKELIQPKKMVLKNDTEYAGTENMMAIQLIMDEIQKWNFYDFSNATAEFMQQWNDSPTVLIFQYEEIPLELVKTILTVEQDDIPAILFQYMIIFPENISGNEGVIYFATNDMKTSVKSRVRYDNRAEFLQKLEDFKQNSHTYLVHQQSNGGMLFVNNEQDLTLETFPYYTTEIPIQTFVEVLFPDPSVVTKTENTFTNGTSLLDVYEDSKTFQFVNPTVTKDQTITTSQLIQTAMNFVNQHGGWTDQYIFSNIDIENNGVYFQLYLNDYMVVDHSSKLSVEIGNSGIYSYKRPYFSLNFPIKPYEKKLPSGEQVLHYLQEMKKINFDDLNDVAIGYEMTYQEDDAMLEFEPKWYFKIGDKWQLVYEEEQGGEKNGLE